MESSNSEIRRKGKRAFIVLGMHRSGTSALTGVLDSLGVELGRDLYAAQKGVNERGFWEHSDIVDAHDDLLALLGSSWDDLLPLPDGWWNFPKVLPIYNKLKRLVTRDFSRAEVWGLKDPRMSLLLPIWQKIFEELGIQPYYAIMFRHPYEVAKSLETRNAFQTEKSLHLWLAHNISAERLSRGAPRVFVNYDQLITNTEESLLAVERILGLSFPVPVSIAATRFKDFISQSLRHHTRDTPTPNTKIERLAILEMDALQQGVKDPQTDSSKFDRVAKEFAEIIESVPSYWRQHTRALSESRGLFKLNFYRIYNSLSWKLVRPLWWIERRIYAAFLKG